MTRWPAICSGDSLEISRACTRSAASWAAVGTAAGPCTASAARWAASPPGSSVPRLGPGDAGAEEPGSVPDTAGVLAGPEPEPPELHPAVTAAAAATMAPVAVYQLAWGQHRRVTKRNT
jgi:hypothetical protein